MRLLIAALVLIGAAVGARAQNAPAPPPRMDGLLNNFSLGGNRGPVKVDADEMEFDYKTMVLTYRGNVVVSQADMTLRANSVRVTLVKEGPQRPKEVVAEGDVRIDSGDRHATGGRAVFDDAKRTVTLSEDARLSDGPNQVNGDRVVVFIDEQRSVVEGGPERVRAVLYPPTERPKQTAENGDAH
jgi:lipopolysaccharide export system protein LptA